MARDLPKVSIGSATAWLVCENRGERVDFTIKYLVEGEKRGHNLGSQSFHPNAPEGEYGIQVFLAQKVFRRFLEEMRNLKLGDVEQWPAFFELAKELTIIEADAAN